MVAFESWVEVDVGGYGGAAVEGEFASVVGEREALRSHPLPVRGRVAVVVDALVAPLPVGGGVGVAVGAHA